MLVSGNAAGQRVGLPWAPQHRSPPWDAPFGVSARLGSHTCCTHAKALGPFHTPVPVPQVFAPRWTLLPHFEAERWPNLCFSMMAFGAGAAWLVPLCGPRNTNVHHPKGRSQARGWSHGCSWWHRTPMGGAALAGAAPGSFSRAQQTYRLLLHCCP